MLTRVSVGCVLRWGPGARGLAAPAASRTNSALVACYFAICTRAWALLHAERAAPPAAGAEQIQLSTIFVPALCRGACVSNFSELLLLLLLLCVCVSGSVCVCDRSEGALFQAAAPKERERELSDAPTTTCQFRAGLRPHIYAKLLVLTTTCHCVCGGLKISSVTRREIAQFYAPNFS
jgi:hypothetical protein